MAAFSRICHGALDARWDPVHDGLFKIPTDLNIGTVAPRALDSIRREEVDRTSSASPGSAARVRRRQLGDERGHLVELLDDVRE